LEQVSELFADHADLLKEFTYFLPDAVQEQAKVGKLSICAPYLQLHRSASLVPLENLNCAVCVRLAQGCFWGLLARLMSQTVLHGNVQVCRVKMCQLQGQIQQP